MNRPTDSVRIAIFDRADQTRFLILTEADDPDSWKLPGGKFNTVSETPVEAAVRELDEELGPESADLVLKEAAQLTNDDGISARYIYIATTGVEQIAPSSEIAVTRWVTEGDVPDGPNRGHILSAVSVARTALAAGN